MMQEKPGLKKARMVILVYLMTTKYINHSGA